MRFLHSLFRQKKSHAIQSMIQWETYCGFSLAERFDQLAHDQVVYLKQIRFSESRDETLASLLGLATGEALAPGVDFESAVLQILDSLNAKAPHEAGSLKREFGVLMKQIAKADRSN